MSKAPAMTVVLLGLAAWAEEPPAAADDPAVVQVKLKAGEAYTVCNRNLIVCPAFAPVCDNPKIAAPVVDEKLGLTWVGVSPGNTLCSAAGGAPANPRKIFRITVR